MLSGVIQADLFSRGLQLQVQFRTITGFPYIVAASATRLPYFGDKDTTLFDKLRNIWGKFINLHQNQQAMSIKTSFLIAAPTSGSGKTTIARGLMKLFTQKGYRVQPFKCGPDYIDTKFHAAVCGRPSINLDTFMASPEHVRELFAHYGADADVCVVEGMMGLFDGYNRELGSSYEIAKVLDIPVVLVVDAKSAAY